LAKRQSKNQLEFEPEELEITEISENSQSEASKANSPLDDMRQMMPKDSKQGN
jgi:hypothetical protein